MIEEKVRRESGGKDEKALFNAEITLIGVFIFYTVLNYLF